jgi:DNA-binding response OmpR family regulator
MKILIAEDNKIIAENIVLYLTTKWYKVDHALDGEKAFEMISRESYDFLIIDRLMPRIDGLSLVRMLQARDNHIPFLFLTALSKQIDKIEWLSLGADDYLVKPFDLEELALRIENILKRKGWTKKEKTHTDTIGDIRIDTVSKRVWKGEYPIELSPKEYAILDMLFRERGIIVSREFLYEELWWEYDPTPETLETVNVHIAHLRKKLSPDIIRTVKLSWYIIDL